MGRKPDDAPNKELEPLPVAWFKNWQTSEGKTARVFQSTMGSGTDLESAGLRRLIINAAYWSMEMESAITAERSVEIVGSYKPLKSGFDYKELGVEPKPVSAYKYSGSGSRSWRCRCGIYQPDVATYGAAILIMPPRIKLCEIDSLIQPQ